VSELDAQPSLNPDQPAGDPEWGYRLNFSPDPASVVHEFCGENRIPGATCPHCEKPLLRLLSLNSTDTALNVDFNQIPEIPLLYCWTCGIPYGEFCYRVNSDRGVTLIKVPPRSEDEFGADGPYEGYTGNFPARKVSLQPIGADEQEKHKTFWSTRDADSSDWDVDIAGHQIGGFPFICNPIRSRCPSCDRDMPLLACICNDATGNDPFGVQDIDSFVDNGGVQMVFHLCRPCAMIAAYHSND
jgi:hypothetical protein